jgi:hypothetical protein
MNTLEHSTVDAVAIAAQLGRLDLVSTLLAAIAVILALGVVPVYMLIQRKAARIARQEVKKATEGAAVAKMEKIMPVLVEEYMELARNFSAISNADEIMQTKNDEECK